MKMKKTPLNDCYTVHPTKFEDARGIFFEAYQKERFDNALGANINFVQDNCSVSKQGVLRGLHFQSGEFAQAKLVQVLKGEVLDVIVDLRKGSATFGEHFKIRLSEENGIAIFIPRGMAHGFVTLSNEALFYYKCDNYYKATAEAGIIYSDKTLNIDWEYPHEKMVLSNKDRCLSTFEELFL
ncbi:dTDP-4-dehydrorhamnose 3,5-epimerase [Pareuzebyella sediminis]|uniref:dTDP-4-dehydrorhamnose 3,5-epimerase n=1 Tax=Pareuzebyella sediminis TaxID=2607998 RepID=UPI0011EE5DDE|nr:dTDP-4-dehydrorhamnose 3,5-epimerase [Pareuzebyella sediminis]